MKKRVPIIKRNIIDNSKKRDYCTCESCGEKDPLNPNHDYMVTKQVWDEAGFGKFNIVCVNCLEYWIGRTLTENDFKDIPLNASHIFLRSIFGPTGLKSLPMQERKFYSAKFFESWKSFWRSRPRV